MPSKAYKTFQKNLNQVNKLIETYNHELERNSGRGKKSLDHLTRAGLIFLCSSFEVYVESVTYETGNFITRKIYQPKKLPMEAKKTISDAVKKEKNDISPILFYDDWKEYYRKLIYYDIKKLNTDKELTIGSEGRYQYIYPGSKDAVGYFTYTYKIVRGNADEHLANSVGEKVEEYQLTVTYHPYSKEVRKQKLAKIKEPDEEVYTAENAPKPDLVEQPKGGISVDSSVASTGTYTVKVIAGELQIVKKLDAQAEKEETFRFTITDKNGDVATATAKIAKGGKEATAVFELVGEANAKLELDNKKLSELSRGDYVVKESSDNTSYELQSIVTGKGTNCDSAIAEDLSNGITFTMGTDKKQNKVPQNGNTTDGRVGIAEFTNKKTVVNIDFEKVDAETNTKKLSGAEFDLYKANTDGEQTGDPIKQYVSDKNGKVSIENLPIGNYVLVERKAPAGYQLSAKPWKIIVGSDRNITVTHGDDTVSPKGNEKIYQLTNAKLYSLPNSGGPGTYGFTISGVAILATALLLFINNKRREEEAKRS